MNVIGTVTFISYSYFSHLAIPVFLLPISFPYGTIPNGFMRIQYNIEFRILHLLENLLVMTFFCTPVEEVNDTTVAW